MAYEFDPRKSESNKRKHGIDFIEAQTLWLDEDRVIYPAKSEDEPRFVLIAVLKAKHWVAFYTTREDRIRIISVRRAREAEQELYES